MDRVVVIVECGGGMFDGVRGLKVLTVPADTDLKAFAQGYIRASDGKTAEYMKPGEANELADRLKALGAQDLPVEWIVIL